MDLDHINDEFGGEGPSEIGFGGGGPSEKELQVITEKFQEEQNIIFELSGKGGPTCPTDWFCSVSHLNFQLNDIKKLIENKSSESLNINPMTSKVKLQM